MTAFGVESMGFGGRERAAIELSGNQTRRLLLASYSLLPRVTIVSSSGAIWKRFSPSSSRFFELIKHPAIW